MPLLRPRHVEPRRSAAARQPGRAGLCAAEGASCTTFSWAARRPFLRGRDRPARWASAARRCARRCSGCATKASWRSSRKSGWYVKPIDFGKLDQLYDLRVVLELASVAQAVRAREDPPALEALKAVWLVPAAERLTDGARSRRARRAVPRHPGARRRQRRDGQGAPGRDRAHPHRAPAGLHARRPHRRHLPGARARSCAPCIQRKLDAGADAAEEPHRAEQDRGAQDQAGTMHEARQRAGG